MDLSNILHSVQSVLTFFIIGCIGYYLARTKKASKSIQVFVATLVTSVALPPYLFYSISSFVERETLLSFAYSSIFPMCSIGLAMVFSYFLSRLIRIPPQMRGLFCVSFSFSNTIYIGMPVNLALFGEEAIPNVILYFFANSLLFWTLGNMLLARDGDTNQVIFSGLKTLRHIFSPPMVGFALGVIALVLNIKLPSFAIEAAKYLGQLCTPLVMLSIGMTICFIGLRNIRFDKMLFFIFFGRFIFCPLAIVALTWFFPIPTLMRKVFIIQASLPSIASLGVLSEYYGADGNYATLVVSSTTLFSLIAIPIFMLLINTFI